MTFKRILVPVDSSDFSRSAVLYAADLGRALQAELVLLNVVEPAIPLTPTYVAPMAGFNPVHKDLIDGARKYVDDLKALFEGVPSVCMVRSGEPGAVILDTATDENIDLIVMATHGRSGLSRLLMGSTTEAVVRHSPVPVLALRAALLVPGKSSVSVTAPPRL
jgi:nucleotide-binding universal stress UspA family protein